MARGQRKSIDDQIEVLDGQIEKAQAKLDELLSKREELEGKKREEALGYLYDMIQESGKSIEDIMMMITDQYYISSYNQVCLSKGRFVDRDGARKTLSNVSSKVKQCFIQALLYLCKKVTQVTEPQTMKKFLLESEALSLTGMDQKQPYL